MSDAHLGFARDEVERAVISFFRHVAESGGSLLINGDLFEFWFEWKSVIPRRGFRTVAALADVVDAGVPVTMVAVTDTPPSGAPGSSVRRPKG